MTHRHAVSCSCQHACFHVNQTGFCYVRKKICPGPFFMKQFLLDHFISTVLYQLRAPEINLLMLVNAGTG